MHREQRTVKQQACSSSEQGCHVNAATGMVTYVNDIAATNRAAIERVVSQNPMLHSLISCGILIFLFVLIKATLWLKTKLL